MGKIISDFRSFIDLGHDLRKKIPGRVQGAASNQWERSQVDSIRKTVGDYFKLVGSYSFQIGLRFIFIPLLVEIGALAAGAQWQWFYRGLNLWFLVVAWVGLYAFSPVFVLIHSIRKIPGDRQYRELLAVFWVNLDLLGVGLNAAILACAFFSLAYSTSFLIAGVLAAIWLFGPYPLYIYKAEIAYVWVRLAQTAFMLLVACAVAASPIPMRHYQSWASRAAANQMRPEEQREVTAKWDRLQWFTQEGEPKIWSSGNQAKGYRLFAAPGYDPQTNEKLTAVSDNETKEMIVANFRARVIAKETQEAEEARQREAALKREQAIQERKRLEDEKQQLAATKAQMLRDYVARPSTTIVSPEHPIVLIALQNNEEMVDLSTRFSAVFNSAGVPNRTSVFTPQFVNSSTFQRLLQGKQESEPLFDTTQFASYFLVINTTVSTSTQQVDGTAVPTIDMICEVRLISSSTARIEHRTELRTRAAGFNDAVARNQASERMEKELSKAAPEFLSKITLALSK